MQAAMDRLAGLLAALPFAARQTEHLTSGGFEVPGSGSAAVERGLTAFDGAQRSQLAVVIARRPGSDASDIRKAVDRVGDAAARTAHVSLPPAARQAAVEKAGSAPVTVVPLRL